MAVCQHKERYNRTYAAMANDQWEEGSTTSFFATTAEPETPADKPLAMGYLSALRGDPRPDELVGVGMAMPHPAEALVGAPVPTRR